MGTVSDILEAILELSPTERQHLLDSLKQEQWNKKEKSPHKNKEPKLPGFGMWADHEDIVNTERYIQELRKPRYTL